MEDKVILAFFLAIRYVDPDGKVHHHTTDIPVKGEGFDNGREFIVALMQSPEILALSELQVPNNSTVIVAAAGYNPENGRSFSNVGKVVGFTFDERQRSHLSEYAENHHALPKYFREHPFAFAVAARILSTLMPDNSDVPVLVIEMR